MVYTPGTMIILNGGSSAGKTTLCKAIQDTMPQPFMLLGIDAFWLALPPKQLNLDLVDPDYYSWRYEKFGDEEYFRIVPGRLLNLAMTTRYEAVAPFLKNGINVVADEVFWTPAWARAAHETLSQFEVFLVGVYCDDAVLESREKARGDRWSGWARGSQFFAHRNMQYDITINTSRKSPTECALEIKSAIDGGLTPHGLKKSVDATIEQSGRPPDS